MSVGEWHWVAVRFLLWRQHQFGRCIMVDYLDYDEVDFNYDIATQPYYIGEDIFK